MQLTMPVVWSDDCRLHDPAAEIWIGVRTPAVETAARTDAILEALRAAGGHTVPAEQHEDGRLLAVHDSGLLEYLASAWADWEQAGLPVDPARAASSHTSSRIRHCDRARSTRPGCSARLLGANGRPGHRTGSLEGACIPPWRGRRGRSLARAEPRAPPRAIARGAATTPRADEPSRRRANPAAAEGAA